METLLKIWTFIDGKKTNIGAALLFAAMIIEKLAEIWMGADTPLWIPKLIETLQFFGGTVFGIGLGHKIGKAMESKAAGT